MNPPTCRACQQTVSLDAVTCPHCDTPRPALAEWNGEGYEWKTAGTWMGTPWIHVAFGLDRDAKLRTARGIIAIGPRARGVIAVGILATGIISIGVISLGVFSLGVLSVALCAAIGVNAVAPIAFGITAFGYLVGGLEPIGWRFLLAPGR